MNFCRAFLLVILVVSGIAPARAEQGLAIDPATCLGCHRENFTISSYAASVHGKIACTSCHVDIDELKLHMRGETKVHPVACERCHKKASAEYYAGVHAARGVRCFDCHRDIHVHTYWKNDKRKVNEICLSCHKKESSYKSSVHGAAVTAGNLDSAGCHDCHGLHNIKPLAAESLHVRRDFHTKVCLKCHADTQMMKRNGIAKVAVRSYMDSYHGKNYRLGFPDRVAGCADCHTAHSIQKADVATSSVHPSNLVRTCAQCHTKATLLFTKFYAHGEPGNRKNYPILFWTFIGMTGLLAGVFAVFWIHTLMWMFRGFVDNREREALLANSGATHTVPHSHKLYRRFNYKHIALHLLVVSSFLGLALTGLPLKFSDQKWAMVMMSIYGGAANAGLIHRICAVATFGYFAGALAMSIHFLFIRKDIPGNWIARLFGPDSLCPNLRDVRDVYGMLRWFVFKGPKPSFERWTYWEKFDFLAVFWGMFAIGGSGLMLWFPEFFGSFLPGWSFNVATIIHSDEALLATGFIFTVHFFNTHGRPEKFPMDFVIFNGQISKQEFIDERGDQWKRYKLLGTTDQYRVEKPSSILYDFLIKGFGFVALFTGLGLLALMIFAFIGGTHH